MQILVLNEADMRAVFSMEQAIAADKEALAAYAKGECNIPLRTNLDVPEHNGQSLYMQGYVPSAQALGVKLVSVFPHNSEIGKNVVPATMVLLDASTGEVCALLDGTWLTRQRTGAMAGAASDILARKDSKIFALFGTGGQAATQLEAILTVRPIKEVRVFDLNKERAQAFADEMQKTLGERFQCTIKLANTAEEAVQDADIITSVTTAPCKTFDGTLVKAGAHVNGVGSYTPQMAEIDEYLVTHAEKVFVDTVDAITEAGNFQQPIKAGHYSADRVNGDLGSVINGTVVGRSNESERTLFITTGNAVLDLVSAKRIYDAAKAQGKGTILEI